MPLIILYPSFVTTPSIPDQGYKTQPKNYELKGSNKEYETEKENNLKLKTQDEELAKMKF